MNAIALDPVSGRAHGIRSRAARTWERPAHPPPVGRSAGRASREDGLRPIARRCARGPPQLDFEIEEATLEAKSRPTLDVFRKVSAERVARRAAQAARRRPKPSVGAGAPCGARVSLREVLPELLEGVGCTAEPLSHKHRRLRGNTLGRRRRQRAGDANRAAWARCCNGRGQSRQVRGPAARGAPPGEYSFFKHEYVGPRDVRHDLPAPEACRRPSEKISASSRWSSTTCFSTRPTGRTGTVAPLRAPAWARRRCKALFAPPRGANVQGPRVSTKIRSASWASCARRHRGRRGPRTRRCTFTGPRDRRQGTSCASWGVARRGGRSASSSSGSSSSCSTDRLAHQHAREGWRSCCRRCSAPQKGGDKAEKKDPPLKKKGRQEERQVARSSAA